MCSLSKVMTVSGLHPPRADTARLMSLVGDLNGKDATLNSLKEQRRSPNITLSESAEIRMQMAQVQKERAAVAEEIRELCHA